MKWPVCQIGDVFDVARGGSPRPIRDYLTDAPDGLNWIMIGDASEESKYIATTKHRIKPEGLKNTRMVREGDFLLSNSMSFGHPYILKTSGCIHDGWLVLSPKDDNVDPDFFYYLLGSESLYREFSRRAAGAVVKNLNTSLVRQVQVPFPPLAEQRRIAAILDKADGIRRKRREAIGLLDQFLRSAFLELVGPGNPEHASWTHYNVEQLAEPTRGSVRTGPFGSALRHSEFVSSGVAVLGIDNAVKNRFAWDERRYVPHAMYEKFRRYTVKAGDVIVTIMGTTGRTAVVPEDIPLAISTKHLAVITVNRKLVHPEYLAHALHLDPGVLGQIAAANRGAIMSGLNLGIIKGLRLSVPLLQQQHRFAAVVDGTRRTAEAAGAAGEQADALFNSLAQQAFRGEV